MFIVFCYRSHYQSCCANQYDCYASCMHYKKSVYHFYYHYQYHYQHYCHHFYAEFLLLLQVVAVAVVVVVVARIAQVVLLIVLVLTVIVKLVLKRMPVCGVDSAEQLAFFCRLSSRRLRRVRRTRTLNWQAFYIHLYKRCSFRSPNTCRSTRLQEIRSESQGIFTVVAVVLVKQQ